MPNGDAQDLGELLSAPIEELLVSLGSGIGRSQAELDRHSIETQRRIDEDAVLAQYGLQATWYQIPTADLELKIAVALERQQGQPSPPQPVTPAPLEPIGRLIGGRLFERPLPRLYLQPVNARYVNQFNYDVNASSTITLRIAAVPPPGPASAGRPTRTADEALSIATPHLLVDAAGTRGRVTVNFNAGAQAWFVSQTEEQNDVVDLLTLVKIDDESGSIVKQTGGR